jgi:hypothetical protein
MVQVFPKCNKLKASNPKYNFSNNEWGKTKSYIKQIVWCRMYFYLMTVLAFSLFTTQKFFLALVAAIMLFLQHVKRSEEIS